MSITTAVGLFENPAGATAAVRALRDDGFADDQIGLITRQQPDEAAHTEEHTGLANDPTHTRWEEGTGIGAAAGAITGAGLGLAVLSGLIPPLGPIIAGGALVALIASAGGGATVGIIVGGLIGLGIPEEEAVEYHGELEAGRTVVACAAGARYAEAVAIMRHYGAIVRAEALK